jgi:hypothetical protein
MKAPVAGQNTIRLVAAGLALLLGTAVSWPDAAAAETVEVATVVLSEEKLDPGREQIVQVTLRNNGGTAASVGLRVTLGDKEGRVLGKPVQRVIAISAYDEQRSYLTLKAPRQPGEYRVQLALFSPDFKRRLAAQEPAFYATFVVTGPKREAVARKPPAGPPAAEPASGAPEAELKPAAAAFQPPPGLRFEAADLLWENFEFSPVTFLVGDTGHIRADLVNVGGDVARDVAVQVTYFNTRIPNKLLPLTESAVAALAPGERIELEWEFKFPEDALLGEYRIVVDARPPEGVTDATPANNRATFGQAVQLSNIRLVFPDPGYVFDEAGLFLFRWESKAYKEFKVQVGVDSGFQDPSRFFDIPQGDKWAVEQEVVPLEGELPVMARGLMERFESDTVYWRVVGRDLEQNRTGTSRVQEFTMRFAAPAPTEEPAEVEGEAEPVPAPVEREGIVPPLPPVAPPVIPRPGTPPTQ